MKACPNCNTQVDDSTRFCPTCGSPIDAAAPTPYRYTPVVDPSDHTAEYDPADIAENKLYGILVYGLGIIGVIVALLGAPNSPYTRFHIRQSLKLTITEVILGFLTVVLSWTIIVAVAGGICFIILAVIQIICFVRACKGEAKEPPIIKGFGFLK